MARRAGWTQRHTETNRSASSSPVGGVYQVRSSWSVNEFGTLGDVPAVVTSRLRRPESTCGHLPGEKLVDLRIGQACVVRNGEDCGGDHHRGPSGKPESDAVNAESAFATGYRVDEHVGNRSGEARADECVAENTVHCSLAAETSRR
jgi:hypothetical protein